MIILVGVVHVVDIAGAVRRLLDIYRPDAVALELDAGRLYALLHPEALREGRAPLLARLMARMERDIAGRFGTTVGAEMLTAYEEAVRRGIRVVLVDMPIGHTLRRLREVPLREKIRLYASLLFYPFLPKRDVRAVMGNVDDALDEFRRRFPSFYRVMVEERNSHIAARIAEAERYGTVMAFVGDAHIPGLRPLLPDSEVIRLSEVLRMRKGYNGMDRCGSHDERA